MSLTPGTRLGIYEITGLIGAGGMGEVYRAKDTTLNRDVAIKVLPASFADDPDRLARFGREAQTLAALNHPHIATIYGVEQSAGMRALVMELVEGEDLSVQIARGPIPLPDALPIAKQIAAALEAAHEHGIIHRDLKPANIKVRDDGTVKVLDFGLAKALAPEGSSAAVEAMNSPTLTARATQMGMILGTAAYMAPEQARGKVVDKRADVWAFGCVLFEMLTGTRAFAGEDVTETLAAVVRGEPDWSLVPKDISPALLVFLRRTLQKDPRQRTQSIGDVRLALEGAFDVPAAPVIQAAAPVVSRTRERVLSAALGVVSLAALTLAAYVVFGRAPAADPPRAMQLNLIPSDGFSFASVGSAAQLSPDAASLVMVARGGLSMRSMASGETRLMPGTDGASYPFWSPDSKNVGFVQQGRIKRVSADGGPVLDVCASATSRGAAWSKDNVILFAPGASAGLFRVPAAGGTPEIVVKPTPGLAGEYIRYPSFLPDGQHFLYQHSTPQEFGFYLGSLDGAAPRMVRPDFSNALYAPPAAGEKIGRLLFVVNRQTLMTQPFDLGGMQLQGEMSPLAEGIQTTGNLGNFAFSASTTGALVYTLVSSSNSQLTIVDRLGRTSSTVGSPMVDPQAAISPDGKQIAYIPLAEPAMFLQQAAGGPPTQIAAPRVMAPVWSTDGRIAFSRGGLRNELFIKHLNGLAQEESLGVSAPNASSTDWSVDGKWIVYQATDNKTGSDLWLLPITGDRKPVIFLQTPVNEVQASFSPDGKWMAYAQNESLNFEVFVQAISPLGAATGIKYRVSAAGGSWPKWKRDSKELIYVSGDGKLTSVPTTLGVSPQFGQPQTLFELQRGGDRGDMTADAQHFLIAAPVGGAARSQAITVVLNWQAGLKK